MSLRKTDGLTRRSLLKTTGAAIGASVVASSGVTAQTGPDYGGWFDDVKNYDGTTDLTGQDAVTVEVGAEGNNGPFAFSPPAIRVDPGTTVTFSWVSNTHNVMVESQPDGGNWDGHETIENEGFEYEHTFETDGVYKYFCQPHLALGMKGAVVVGGTGAGGGGDGGAGGSDGDAGAGGSDGDAGAGGSDGDGGTGSESGYGNGVMSNSESLLLTGGLLTAFFAPIVFGIYLLVRGPGDDRRKAAAPTWKPGKPTTIEPTEPAGSIEEAQPYADVVTELGHDDFNPVGTGTLVIMYFVLVVLLWFFMYFVEFLGNGPTVIG